MTRWWVSFLVVAGCAKGLQDLYPFHCPVDMSACPLGNGATCDPLVGCTLICSTDANCIGGGGDPRDDLVCVSGVCQLACTNDDGSEDPGTCPDGYGCFPNTSPPVTKARFSCKLM